MLPDQPDGRKRCPLSGLHPEKETETLLQADPRISLYGEGFLSSPPIRENPNYKHCAPPAPHPEPHDRAGSFSSQGQAEARSRVKCSGAHQATPPPPR